MPEFRAYSRRAFGPFYWAPRPLGLLAIFYAGLCVEGYWDRGNLGILAFGVFSVSLGITLVMIDNRSYIVAGFNTMLALLTTAIVARSGQWVFMYLPFMCIIFAIAAFLPRHSASEKAAVGQFKA